MSQVTARLRLEAASMSSNEDKFKEFYAAKVFKNKKKHVGRAPKDHCHVHPNDKHLNEACFKQKDCTAVSASNHNLTNAEVIRRYCSLFSSQNKTESKEESSKLTTPGSKTAAVATASTQDDNFITYSSYTVSASITDNPCEFLLDTGANTHLTHDSTLLHNLQTIKPVFIKGIVGTSGRSWPTKLDLQTYCVPTYLAFHGSLRSTMCCWYPSPG